MPLPEEQQRLNNLNRVIRDPGFGGLGPADQLDIFREHLASQDAGFAGLTPDEQSTVAGDLLRQMKPGWGETAADVASVVPIVGGAIHGYRSAQAGEPGRYFTEKTFGASEDPIARAFQEGARDAVETVLMGAGASVAIKYAGAKLLTPLAEGVTGALAKVGAEEATTLAAQIGKSAVARKYAGLLATDITAGVMLGGVSAMERGEVKPFEDFVETPLGVGILSLGFLGLGRAAQKFGQFRTQRILQGLEGLNDSGFAKFVNEDGPAFVNAVKKKTGMTTEEAATFAEKVATQPVYGPEAKMIRDLLKAQPELLHTEVGQHILRMQRDAVLRTEVKFNDKPLTIHYEPTVDAPEFGFQKRWDKTETNLTPERMQQLIDAHKAGMIHIQNIEGKFNEINKFGELVRDPLDPAGKSRETPVYLLPGVTPGGKRTFLDPTKSAEAIPDLPDFYQNTRPSQVLDEFGRPMEVAEPPGRAGLPMLRPKVPQTADDFAHVWEKIMLESDPIEGRTPRELTDFLDRTPYPSEHPDKTIARLGKAQKEVDNELEVLAYTQAYLSQKFSPEVAPTEVSPVSDVLGRYTKTFKDTVFDAGEDAVKKFAKENQVTPSELRETKAREKGRTLAGHIFANTEGITPTMEAVANRYKKNGPPKTYSKQLKQALKEAGITPEKGDVKGALDQLVTKVDELKKKANLDAVAIADEMAGSWSRKDALRQLGMTEDDYAQAVIERAGYTIDSTSGKVVNTASVAANSAIQPLPPIVMNLDRAVQTRARPIKGLLGTDIAAVGPTGEITTFTPKSRDKKTGRWLPAQEGISANEIEFVMRNQPPPFISAGARLEPGQQITLRGPLEGGPGEQVTVVSIGLDGGATVRYENGDQLFALLDQSGNLKVQSALLKRATAKEKQLKLERLRQVAGEREIKPGQEIYIMSPDKKNPDFLYRITKVEGADVYMVGGISEEPVTIPIVNILSALEDGELRLAEWIHPENRAMSKRAKVGIGAEYDDNTFAMLHKTGTTARGNARGTFDDFVGMMEQELENRFTSDVRNLEPRQKYNLAGPMYKRRKTTVVDTESPTLAFKEKTVFDPVNEWVVAKGEKGNAMRRRMAIFLDEQMARRLDYLESELIGWEKPGAAETHPPGAKADAIKANVEAGKREPSKKCP